MKLKLAAAVAATACGIALAQVTPPNAGALRADKDSPNTASMRASKDSPATAGKHMSVPQSGVLAPAKPSSGQQLQPGSVSRAPASRSPAVGRAEGDDGDEDRKVSAGKQPVAQGKPLLGPAGAPTPGELPGGDKQRPTKF